MNNSEIIKRLNELFEESIIHLPDEKVLEEIEQTPKDYLQPHLNYIKKLNAKAKAKMQKSISTRAKEILEDLINEIGTNELVNRLLEQPKYQQLKVQLFSKYKGLTEEDKGSMLTDRKFMDLVKELKKDLENEEDTNG